jgi:hypothetical protein
MSAHTGEAEPLSARRTALLVGVLAVLAGYLWVFELRPRPPGASPPPEAPALLPVAPAAVARVELVENGRPTTARRAGDGWTDEAGRPWRGDVVGDLLYTLAALRPVMVVDADPGRPADYGLGAGAGRLMLYTEGGPALLTLELGDRNPAWTGVYARRADSREVMLVGGVLTWELDKFRRAAPAQ